MTMAQAEEWRRIPIAPDYEVSNQGRVRSRKWGRLHSIRLSGHPKGYLGFHAADGPKRRRILVHKAVLLAFCGERPDGMDCCRHLNGDPADNRPQNLRWGTFEEQEADKGRHGRKARGERQGSVKLTDEDVVQIWALRGRATTKGTARSFGVSPKTIRSIWQREWWRHITRDLPGGDDE